MPRPDRPHSSRPAARSLSVADVSFGSGCDSARSNLAVIRIAAPDHLPDPQMSGGQAAFSHFVECMRQRRKAGAPGQVQRGGLRLASAPRTIARPPSSGLPRRPLTPSAMTVTFDSPDLALMGCRKAGDRFVTAVAGPAPVARRLQSRGAEE